MVRCCVDDDRLSVRPDLLRIEGGPGEDPNRKRSTSLSPLSPSSRELDIQNMIMMVAMRMITMTSSIEEL